ncbi:hypothetical protein V491_02247, partial [Pseudogymnoascus sp. VKM F-3775]
MASRPSEERRIRCPWDRKTGEESRSKIKKGMALRSRECARRREQMPAPEMRTGLRGIAAIIEEEQGCCGLNKVLRQLVRCLSAPIILRQFNEPILEAYSWGIEQFEKAPPSVWKYKRIDMEPASATEEYDLVVVGAGIYGLAVAKTYHQVNPSARLLILDSGISAGGTWCAERLYDGLFTNNLVGMLEFSDFSMDFETFGVAPNSHVPGLVMHRYLTAYARHFGVYDRIKFRSTVASAELLKGGEWHIKYDVVFGDVAEPRQLVSKKMVLATGTTSVPTMPHIKGSEEFGGSVFHFKDLPQRGKELSEAKNIVVLGGSKSAADAVYYNATRGKRVDWVIRESGRGPAWFKHAFVSPLKLQFEKLATTRFMTFLCPSIYLDAYPTIRRLLHDTRIGRALLRGLFSIIDNDAIAAAKYNDHPETKKLIPHGSIVWTGTSVGIFNYPTDFFSLFHQGLVNVHIADITSLSSTTVNLSDGTALEAQALIYATGWRHVPTVTILPESLTPKLALAPASPDDPSIRAADAEIMHRFPELRNQPPSGPGVNRNRAIEPSYRAYRSAVPPAFLYSRNLAYCG